jgi:hypothetical protein
MRLITDVLLVLAVIGMLAGALWYKRQLDRDEAKIRQAEQAVSRFQQEIDLQSVIAEAKDGRRAYPASIDPEWFQGDVPVNPLLGEDHPWVEIASKSQAERLHPPKVIAAEPEVAGFWYNPHKGVVRARVPVEISDEKALALYNRINRCYLDTLFQVDEDD